ncbi:hypothetical protein [Halomarina litorea]|uniref:hypothetical protein n=1 Tax=Halomarina litorea TaxID=2961595 RepID=UPI0020C435DB|nr:hypothetical protein [Halomarina sp. BCD28]
MTSLAALTTLTWTFRRAILLTVLGWQATYATLGAIASEQAVLSLVTLVVALVLAVSVGVFARGRTALVPMSFGAGYTFAAALTFAVAVPLGVFGPVPNTDAYQVVPWRAVAAVMYFALFAGLPCFALAAWMLLTGRDGLRSHGFVPDVTE